MRLASIAGPVLADHTDPRQRAPAVAVAAILDELGPDVSGHCSFDGLRDGELFVAVDDPRLVAPMRTRCVFALRERLRQALPSVFVRRIEFRSGRGRRNESRPSGAQPCQDEETTR